VAFDATETGRPLLDALAFLRRQDADRPRRRGTTPPPRWWRARGCASCNEIPHTSTTAPTRSAPSNASGRRCAAATCSSPGAGAGPTRAASSCRGPSGRRLETTCAVPCAARPILSWSSGHWPTSSTPPTGARRRACPTIRP
jgi:hypothetical protein